MVDSIWYANQEINNWFRCLHLNGERTPFVTNMAFEMMSSYIYMDRMMTSLESDYEYSRSFYFMKVIVGWNPSIKLHASGTLVQLNSQKLKKISASVGEVFEIPSKDHQESGSELLKRPL
ncbi:hypothetical protein CDAR_71651 [Caerostris darwini]|uniref:Uncharacterized protein n=1 Tax=Caerostris darwini TaxID=1538125 RepID=A0AAV4NJ65_9ARAC|nr:hypothetical protein CDAR_71651 [Caerostris darwini]